MAITNIIDKIAVARIADCEIKVSGGSLTDVVEVADVKASVDWDSASAKGEGAVFAVSTKMSSAKIEFGHMALSASLLAALTGATAPAVSGTTPSLIRTTTFKVTDVAPYFSFEVKATDITGLETVGASDTLPADAHIKFPKCKITSITDLLPPVDGFCMVKVTATAIHDSDTLFTLITNQTAANIA